MAVALFVFKEAILAESAAHEHSAWDVVVSTISLFVPSHQLQNLWQQIPLYVPETVHQRHATSHEAPLNPGASPFEPTATSINTTILVDGRGAVLLQTAKM